MPLPMTRPNRHRVQRQIVELAIGDSADGPAVHREMARPFWDRAVPELERVFDEVAGPHELLRLDRLELDLGQIDGADWPIEFRRKPSPSSRGASRSSPPFRKRLTGTRRAIRGGWNAGGSFCSFCPMAIRRGGAPGRPMGGPTRCWNIWMRRAGMHCARLSLPVLARACGSFSRSQTSSWIRRFAGGSACRTPLECWSTGNRKLLATMHVGGGGSGSGSPCSIGCAQAGFIRRVAAPSSCAICSRCAARASREPGNTGHGRRRSAIQASTMSRLRQRWTMRSQIHGASGSRRSA